MHCPTHVADLTSVLRKLAVSNEVGVFHLAGADALSRYSLSVLIAHRDGISPSDRPRHAAARPPAPRVPALEMSRGDSEHRA
ncbi:hypothetical protein [Streptomyces gardneri]|uniref:hypothetical protein n=1 Tax=Streptomyces gardneri TaxID=66892 RepID=UPI0036B4EF79